jgi:hypothetical protein
MTQALITSAYQTTAPTIARTKEHEPKFDDRCLEAKWD